MEGNVYKVVEFQHVKPGKGAAFVRTKIKNVISGAVLEKHLIHQKNIQEQKLKKREMQYLYEDGGFILFYG